MLRDVMAGASPWAFQAHYGTWAVLGILAAAYTVAWRRGYGGRSAQAVAGAAALVLLAATLTWPAEDLAARWSVTAHIGQHVALALICAPLVLLALPRPMVMALSTPDLIDRVLRVVSGPLVAAIIFNSVMLGVHLPPVVTAEVSWRPLHSAVNALVLAAGLVMWLPVLRTVPGEGHLSAPARVTYLLVQSIVPNVPAAFLTFASEPVYRAFMVPSDRLGVSPIVDTQVAGAAAKIVAASILWMAAALVFFRAHRAEQKGTDPDPLTWDDVARELRRADRRGARGERRVARSLPAPTDASRQADPG